ncbi:MAG: hypothetical protein J7501_18900 [Bdellovibrio sp.]|nr:hypothetical protein [Bdellovibrio sp.]
MNFLTLILALSASSYAVTNESASIKIFKDSNHGDLSLIQTMINKISTDIKGDNSGLCYFVEMDPHFQDSINKYMSKNKSYEDSFLKAWNEYVQRMNFPNAKSVLPKVLLSYLRDHGFQVFTADISKTNSDLGKETKSLIVLMEKEYSETGTYSQATWKRYVETMVIKRNQAFAENIKKLITQNKCKRSFFLVGNAHLRSTVPNYGPAVTPLQEYLSKYGYSVIVEN